MFAGAAAASLRGPYPSALSLAAAQSRYSPYGKPPTAPFPPSPLPPSLASWRKTRAVMATLTSTRAACPASGSPGLAASPDALTISAGILRRMITLFSHSDTCAMTNT